MKVILNKELIKRTELYSRDIPQGSVFYWYTKEGLFLKSFTGIVSLTDGDTFSDNNILIQNYRPVEAHVVVEKFL